VLADIEAQDVARTPTGQEELDRVLGGGIVEGGVGAAITQHIDAHVGSTPGARMPRVHTMGVPTTFISQAKPDAILASLGLDAAGVATAIRAAATR